MGSDLCMTWIEFSEMSGKMHPQGWHTYPRQGTCRAFPERNVFAQKPGCQVGSGRDGSTQMGTSMSGTFNTGALSVTIGEGTTPANSIILRGDK
jgi:hypothetical protein